MVNVGTFLELNAGRLSDVRADEIHTTMLDRWLKRQDHVTKRPTLRILNAALKKYNHNAVAKEIRSKNFIATGYNNGEQ